MIYIIDSYILLQLLNYYLCLEANILQVYFNTLRTTACLIFVLSLLHNIFLSWWFFWTHLIAERAFYAIYVFHILHWRWSCCWMRDLSVWHFEGYWVVNINFSDNVWTWIHSDQQLSGNSDNCAKYFTQSESAHRVIAASCQQRHQ